VSVPAAAASAIAERGDAGTDIASPAVAGGAGSGENASAWTASLLEAARMLRKCRASGRRVRAEMRGTATCDGTGRSRSVAARRTRRRRPSGNATATKAGPRAQVRESSFSCCPQSGWRVSTMVTVETIPSKSGAAWSIRERHLRRLAGRSPHPLR
jgi:hypothetical protein